ncbi:MAG: restriction endonuclease subunit S [Deltaproteobacteria bacterium]|nr:restriction endonuclease subunit S [Deltaproteobacteria bacterium]
MSEKVKPGYKQTEVGVIPKEWEVKRLGEIATIATGNTPPTWDAANYGDEFLFVGPVDLGEAKRITSTEKRLSKKGFAISRRFPKNSILFVCIGSTIGKCGIASVELTSNQQINSIFPSPDFSVDYLYYSVCTAVPKIRALAGEQAVPIVNKTQFLETMVAIPPLPEQRVIADALSDVDALIDALDQLIAKKRNIKQAGMQQLLTGQKRLPGFHGKWEVKHLGDVGMFSKGSGIKKDEVVADGLPCVRYGEIYTHHNDYLKAFNSFITPATAEQSQRIEKGDLLFAGSGETAEEIGKCIAFLGNQEAYAGGDIVIFRPVGQDSMFLGYLMNQSSVASQKARMGQGDAVVHISARNLAQLKLHLPSQSEQTAIADVLSDMDAELEALEARRDKTRALKLGMMQELLTGRTRLV